jgi:hypothetical protein
MSVSVRCSVVYWAVSFNWHEVEFEFFFTVMDVLKGVLIYGQEILGLSTWNPILPRWHRTDVHEEVIVSPAFSLVVVA